MTTPDAPSDPAVEVACVSPGRDGESQPPLSLTDARQGDPAADVERLRAENAELRARIEKLASGCPFDHPDCTVREDEPCPVCGTLNDMDAPNLCPFPVRRSPRIARHRSRS